MDAIEACLPVLCTPNGPSRPWGEPVLWVVDTLRMVMAVAAGVVIAACVSALIGTSGMGWYQRVRFAALAVFSVSVIGTELDHIGDYGHYRLIINLIAVALALYGSLAFFSASAGAHRRHK